MMNEQVLANMLEVGLLTKGPVGACARVGSEPQVLGISSQPLLMAGLWLSFFSTLLSVP